MTATSKGGIRCEQQHVVARAYKNVHIHELVVTAKLVFVHISKCHCADESVCVILCEGMFIMCKRVCLRACVHMLCL